MVAFLDEHDKAHSVDKLVCAPVSGGYRVDCDQSEPHVINKDQETYCGTGYAIVQLTFGEKSIETMGCCRVVLAALAYNTA